MLIALLLNLWTVLKISYYFKILSKIYNKETLKLFKEKNSTKNPKSRDKKKTYNKINFFGSWLLRYQIWKYLDKNIWMELSLSYTFIFELQCYLNYLINVKDFAIWIENRICIFIIVIIPIFPYIYISTMIERGNANTFHDL